MCAIADIADSLYEDGTAVAAEAVQRGSAKFKSPIRL